jgi:hypothetical protein
MSSFSLLRSFSTDTNTPSPTPPKRRINKRFSFHQKQHQSVKDPIEASSMGRDKKVKANLTRRWSSLKQYQTTNLSQQSLATGNCSSSTSPMRAGEKGLNGAGSDVKKKWEVIEHYRDAMDGREAGSVSSSLLAVSKRLTYFFYSFSYKSDAGGYHNLQCRHKTTDGRRQNLVHEQKLYEYARQHHQRLCWLFRPKFNHR